MSIFFSSDVHLGHANIIKFCDREFDSVEDMNEILIENWNKTVKQNDFIYFLGDLTMSKKKVAEYLDRLNGKIHFIYGNHDRSTRKIIKNHKNVISAKDLMVMNINKQAITLCHYAMRVWNKSHYGAIHCYGHSHGTIPPYKNSMDVGVDSAFQLLGEYRPFSLEEVLYYTSEEGSYEVKEVIYEYVEYLYQTLGKQLELEELTDE